MAKAQTPPIVCQSCGATYRKWAGRCEACGEWNSIVEEAGSVRCGTAASKTPGRGQGQGGWS